MGQNGKNKNKDEKIVIYSYDPPMPKGESGLTKKDFDEKYKNDPEFRKVIDDFLKH